MRQDVYRYHREVSYALLSAADRNSAQVRAQNSRITTHMRAAGCVCALYVVLLVYFAAVAPGIDACGHKTCGADISWSAIVLVTAAGWFFTLRAARRYLDGEQRPQVVSVSVGAGSAAVVEMRPASDANKGEAGGAVSLA